ncbi:lytic polysaccharide monooxygenase [Cystobasidium minutum MCA 4210]|uniref:lytic polysaccharide monooxygenase n=1 Tax=Cystobasidium minutum MCA 4210 TaxID=1397322 RepID=UPI0034CFA76C|eukprot:jgi/Rhomi1/212577/estExt_Genemark1.C_70065
MSVKSLAARALQSHLLTCLLLAIPARGHLRMSKPPALGALEHPAYSDPSTNKKPYIEYVIQNPIANASEYPCRGHHVDVNSGLVQATETIRAGDDYNVTIYNNNGTDHTGGSCQISLSYDGGASFGVIHSFIGGCPTCPNDTNSDVLPFKIPNDIPSGKNVLLAWNWWGRLGIMEMYMNCAAINIESTSVSKTVPASPRVGVLDSNCRLEQVNDFVFPNPGPFVTYGGTWAGKKPNFDPATAPNCTDAELGKHTVKLISNDRKPIAQDKVSQETKELQTVPPAAGNATSESQGHSNGRVPPRLCKRNVRLGTHVRIEV